MASSIELLPHVTAWQTDTASIVRRILQTHRESPSVLRKNVVLLENLIAQWDRILDDLEAEKIRPLTCRVPKFPHDSTPVMIVLVSFYSEGWRDRIDASLATVKEAEGLDAKKLAMARVIDFLRWDWMKPMELLHYAMLSAADILEAKIRPDMDEASDLLVTTQAIADLAKVQDSAIREWKRKGLISAHVSGGPGSAALYWRDETLNSIASLRERGEIRPEQ